MRTLLALCVFFPALAALGGCGLAPSIHPLSDDETTVLDERLIGRWYAVDEKGESVNGTRPDLVYVGRRAGTDDELEAVALQMESDRVKEVRFRLRATKIGERCYLSATSDDLETEEPAPRRVWLLVHYEFDSPELLRIRHLDPEFAAEAIRAGKLAGQLEITEGTEEDPEYDSILFEASTRDLREWVAANAARAFSSEEVGRLRRAEAPDEEDETEHDE